MGRIRGGWLINSKYFSQSSFSRVFLEKNFGLGSYLALIIESRLEFLSWFLLSKVFSSQWIVLIKTLYLIVPYSRALKKRRLINIYYLDLVSSFRGWRHSKGLPVRGQRT